MLKKIFVAALTLVATTATGVGAATYKLQPGDEDAVGAAKDVFVYEFLNWNMDNAAFGFKEVLGSSDTTPASGPPYPHSTTSYLQFDMASVPYQPSDITKVTLNLYVTSVGFFPDPSSDYPVPVNVAPALSAWTEGGLTWATKPAHGAVLDSESVTAIGQLVTLDITSLALAWIADPSSNYGVNLFQPNPVRDAANRNRGVGYWSSAATDASVRPFLEVTAVPEPATVSVVMVGTAMVLSARRRSHV